MVHGRADEAVRSADHAERAGRSSPRAATSGARTGEALHEAYAFLRTLEHRIQLYQLRRTHVVPEDEASLRRLGRSLGYYSEPVARARQAVALPPARGAAAAREALLPPAALRRGQARRRRRPAVPEAAKARLAALGYLDPKAALRHLEALTSGVSRTAQIQRTLLPVMLEWFADAPDPDAGLFGFRRISESLGRTPWYLRLLRDEGEVAQRMALVLGTCRYATDLLQREPQGVQILGGDLSPLSAEALTTEMKSVADRQSDPEEAVRAIRAVRRRELLRISVRRPVRETDVAEVGYALTDSPTRPSRRPWRVAMDAVRVTRGARRGCRPGWRSSRWGGTAASSWATAATPT